MTAHKVQHVALTFDDGTLGIMQLILDPNLPPEANPPGYAPETGQRSATDEAIEHEIARSQFEGRTVVSWARVAYEDIPLNRSYRNAWKHDGKTIVHDMPTARSLHREKIREARSPLLAQLDVEYQRADERGDVKAKKEIAARKQRLRDAPADPDIEHAQSIGDLISIWPLG